MAAFAAGKGQHQRQWRDYECAPGHARGGAHHRQKRQVLLTPEIKLEGWWTSLPVSDKQIVQLYAERGTAEQFHSQFKMDLDVERLPSGKFATHTLVLTVSMLAYHILPWVGQNGLLGPLLPKRHRAKRRRIRTVMQELMVVAARAIKTAASLKLAFGRDCRSQPVFECVYRHFAYGWLSIQPNKPLV